MPGYAPEPYESFWGVLTPIGGPYSAGETLGVWFQVDTPGELVGFRQYSDGRHPNFALFQLWDATPHLLAMATRTPLETARDPGGQGWRNVWCHPRITLAASTPYLVSASLTEFWADFGTLTSATVAGGHFTVYQDGTGPTGKNGVYDAVTDSSGLFRFVEPPDTDTNGNFYAIDVLLKFPL